MRPKDEPAANPDPPAEGINLRARASDNARILQAGRDQHIYLDDEVRRVRPGVIVEECPYPGLAAFGPEQANWFFGRDELVADLVTRLDQRLRTGGIQLVVAPSGAGKSSLLRAGLLPRLDHGVLVGSARWPKLLCTPTASPLWMLATKIAWLAGTNPVVVAGKLAADPSSCRVLLADALHRRGGGMGRVVVVVDQFEELFSLCTDKRERRAFIDALAEIAGSGADSVGLVVVGLRADFYAACVDHPRLRAALQDAALVVGPMSEAELRAAIRNPARMVGLDLESGLVEVLLRDLGAAAGSYEAGRLPLLAHALRVSWQQRHGSTLTLQGYRNTGGIQHAVAVTADQVYRSLNDASQLAAQRLILRLIRIGDGTEDTRRRVAQADLLSAGVDPAGVAAVVDAFTRARLLTQEQDRVEITHEALLHSWPQLRAWINSDRAGRLVHQNLEEAAAAWDRGRRDPALLYRGSRLEVAHAWAAAAPPGELSHTGQAFLAAGLRARRRSVRLRTGIITALTALALVASIAAVVAFQNQREARSQQAEALRQRDLTTYNRVVSEADQFRGTDVSLSAQLALVAHRMRPGDETYTRLITAANTPLSTPPLGSPYGVYVAVFSPDGHILASAGGDHAVRLWDVSDPTRPSPRDQQLTGYRNEVFTLAFSPDGHILASGDNDSVRLWNMSDPAHPVLLGQIPNSRGTAVHSLAFSRDGHTLAAAYTGDTARLWNVSNPAKPVALGQLLGDQGRGDQLALSPDGHTLAVAGFSDSRVWLWNVANPVLPALIGQPLTGHTIGIAGLAFSPDGHTLASAGTDNLVRLWNVTDPSRTASLGALIGHTSPVHAVAFSPDGLTLASASGGRDRSVRLWNVSDVTHPVPLGPILTGHTNAVRSVAFSPDGRTLASASEDRSVRLWNLPYSPLTGNAGATQTAAVSPDGHTLASGGPDRSVRLWNITDPARPVQLGQRPTGLTGLLWSVVFSPDGHILVCADTLATVQLWNVTDPTQPTPIAQIPNDRGIGPFAIAFSPDGRTLVSGGQEHALQLWNVSDPARPVALGQPVQGDGGRPISLAFGPDGRTLAAGYYGGLVRLWNVSDPSRPVQLGWDLKGHNDFVNTVAFSPDGRTLASGSADFTVRLWDVSNPARPAARPQPLGHPDRVLAVAFSPDGYTLASGSNDFTVRLWDVSDPARPTARGQPLTGHTGVLYGAAFSADGHTLVTEAVDQSIRLWELDVDRDIAWICAVTRGTLTPKEWQRYVSVNVPFNPPCPA